MKSVCVGCGLALPPTGGPTHRYIVSSPECWNVYGTVLAREYENPTLFQAVHQLTVDSYAVHHPTDHPAKSLVLHLLSLYQTVELGRDQAVGRAAIGRYLAGGGAFPTLSPPAELGPITVLDVAHADVSNHADVVRAWARQLWDAWGEHHSLISRLAAG